MNKKLLPLPPSSFSLSQVHKLCSQEMKFVGGYLFAFVKSSPQIGPGVTNSVRSSSLVVLPRRHFTSATPSPRSTSFSVSVRRNMSSSSQTSSYDETTQALIEKSKYSYPLIDVDCNLIHGDLTSMLAESKLDTYERLGPNCNHFRILHHPSTVASNIQGVFSPTSTIDEAESFHSQLLKSTVENLNYIDVRMSVGVHPYHAEEAGDLNEIESHTYDRVKALMENDKESGYVTCIGETGLDYSDGFPDKEKQIPWFEFQLKMAKQYELPLFIHERLAFDDTIRLIDEVFPSKDASPPIIVHCFTGTMEECKTYIERGYYISVSGYILKNGDGPEEVKACLRDGIIPLDRLMIETDAPYMGFNSARESYFKMEEATNEEFMALKSKKRKNLIKSIYPNVPSALPKVLEQTLSLLNEGRRERDENEISMEEGAAAIFANSVKFFDIKTK